MNVKVNGIDNAISVGSFISLFIGTLLFASFACLFNGFLVMLLWNWLMPDIFGLKVITYWQGFGIAFLCSILFKNNSTAKKARFSE